MYTLSFKMRFTVFHFPAVLTMGLKKDYYKYETQVVEFYCALSLPRRLGID